MPSSSSCRINGIFTDAEQQTFLKICVVSVPEKGKANRELITFLAKRLGVSKSQCQIVNGELDRYKKIKIAGDAQVLLERVEQLTGESK